MASLLGACSINYSPYWLVSVTHLTMLFVRCWWIFTRSQADSQCGSSSWDCWSKLPPSLFPSFPSIPFSFIPPSLPIISLSRPLSLYPLFLPLSLIISLSRPLSLYFSFPPTYLSSSLSSLLLLYFSLSPLLYPSPPLSLYPHLSVPPETNLIKEVTQVVI